MAPVTDAREQVIRLLREARSVELHRIAELRDAAGGAPDAYRERLKAHMDDERRHADRVQTRLDQLGGGPRLLEAGLGVLSGFVAVGLRLARRPLDLVEHVATGGTTFRGPREQAAAEAFELSGYVALERVAADSGDTETAELAREIQRDERGMLEALEEALLTLADDLAAAPAEEPEPPPEPAESEPRSAEAEPLAEPEPLEADLIGAEAAPSPAAMRETAREAADEDVELVAEVADPGAEAGAGAEIHVDPPWEGYDRMTAAEIERRLENADAVVAAAVQLYERSGKGRESVLRAAEHALKERSARAGRT
jgi:ferritin-like metal-binding protein YciE